MREESTKRSVFVAWAACPWLVVFREHRRYSVDSAIASAKNIRQTFACANCLFVRSTGRRRDYATHGQAAHATCGCASDAPSFAHAIIPPRERSTAGEIATGDRI